jgi:hypothetical protein
MQGYELTKSDYEDILTYYDIDKPTKLEKTKALAEQILANKLCRCIKRVGKQYKKENEQRNIGICRKAVVSRKNLNIFKFRCKEKKILLPGKSGNILRKTSKKLKLNKKTRKNK